MDPHLKRVALDARKKVRNGEPLSKTEKGAVRAYHNDLRRGRTVNVIFDNEAHKIYWQKRAAAANMKLSPYIIRMLMRYET